MKQINKSQNELGLRILTIFAGIFFLIPGIFKVLFPSDFKVFLQGFPEFIVSLGILGFLFWVVTFLQIVGGISLISGFKSRIFAIPFSIISIVALLTVAITDTESSIQLISILSHIFGAILYFGLFFTGNSKTKSLDKGNDYLDNIISKNKRIGNALIRISVGFFFTVAGALHLIFISGYSEFVGQAIGLTGIIGFLAGLFAALLELVGGLALLTGKKYKLFLPYLVVLTLTGLFTVVIGDSSKIGLINILFHVLIIGTLTSLNFLDSTKLFSKK